MWVAKLRGFDEEMIYGTLAVKNDVTIHYYPLNHYSDESNYYFLAVGIITGSRKNVDSFFNDLMGFKGSSKNKRYVENLEFKGNFFICTTAQPKTLESRKFVRFYYNPKFIHIDPAVITPDGYEEWHIASNNKKDIEYIVKISKREYKGELKMLKQKSLGNIGILSVFPELTDRQKEAFTLAMRHGYYEYPRKTELKKLAAMMGLSLSTYQAHLRKAEISMLSFVSKKYF